MSIEAVIFDIDQTLLDWSGRLVGWFSDPQGHNLHLAQLARHFAPQVNQAELDELSKVFRQHQRELLQEVQDGDGPAPHLGRMLHYCLGQVGLVGQEASPDELLRLYNWVRTPDVKPFPDVIPGLQALTAAGYRFGIITNGYQPMWQRDLELESYGLLHFFPSCRFSAADLGILKPDPQIFETALNCLGLQASQAVYVGDDPVMDVLGAQEVNMKGIWRIPTGQDENAWKFRVKPDGTITHLGELLGMLAAW
jgi:FMN phosphatase YigB (HAD superfamily)